MLVSPQADLFPVLGSSPHGISRNPNWRTCCSPALCSLTQFTIGESTRRTCSHRPWKGAPGDSRWRRWIRLLGAEPGPQLRRSARLPVVAVGDMRPERLAAVRSRYPAVGTTPTPASCSPTRRIDAVAIATPVSTHFALALEALEAGKHVLVEKPIADTSSRRAPDRGGRPPQARAAGRPHVRLHRRRAQDQRAGRRAATSAASTTTTRSA